jgi:hypothetical protein
MFAFLGLGWGEVIVIGVIGVGLALFWRFVIKLILKAAGESAGRKSDEMRKIHIELDCLREENEQMREEIKRLREHVSPSADTGIKPT